MELTIELMVHDDVELEKYLVSHSGTTRCHRRSSNRGGSSCAAHFKIHLYVKATESEIRPESRRWKKEDTESTLEVLAPSSCGICKLAHEGFSVTPDDEERNNKTNTTLRNKH